jgi:hypothetical protein
MPSLVIALLFSIVCARSVLSRDGQLGKRAYQDYGADKVRGGTVTLSLNSAARSDKLLF